MRILLILCTAILSLYAQISIEQAWRKVEDRNDGLKAVQSDIHRAQLKRESSNGMNYPSLSLTASYTHLNEPVGLDISDISSKVNSVLQPLTGHALPNEIDFLDDDIGLVNLHLLYPLYTGGKITAAQSAYDAKISEAVALQHLERDKTFLKLIKYYYGCVMSDALYQTRLDSQKALQLHYMHAKKMKEQGQISRAELLNAQVKLDAARIESKKAQHQLNISRKALSSLIKENNIPHSPLFICRILAPQKHYAKESITRNAGIDILKAKAQAADALINIEKSAWHPDLFAYGNLNLYKGESPLEEMTPGWLVGIMLKFDLFSQKDRAKEIEAAKLLRSKVSSLKAQAQEDLKLAVEKTYGEMMLYQEEFDSLSSSMALAQENYKLRTLAFKEGLSTSSEVIDAQAFLRGAKTKRFHAAYNYVQKLALLCVLSGDAEHFFRFENAGIKVK